MAVYASTTTLDIPRVERLFRNLAVVPGKCDITNYNQVGAEITALTKKFKNIIRVICDGFSDNGFLVRWDVTDKCFHAFYPTAAAEALFNVKDNDNAGTVGVPLYFDEDGTLSDRVQFVSPTNVDGTDTNIDITAAAGGEVADDVDVGEISFLAIGFWH